MNPENLIKAHQSAAFVAAEIREAHKAAIDGGEHFAEILLLDLIGEAVALETKLARLVEAAIKTP